jgi:pimeloyl-ACP methyl ester carboxylesterase
VREPEVSGVVPALCWVALAFLVALPVLSGLGTAFVTTAFLVEFLSEGRPPLLSRLTPPPSVRPLAIPPEGLALAADLYQPFTPWPSRNVVLVHGLSPAGKGDPRLQEAARLLARAGFRVLVPTVPGLTRLRLRPDDAETVVQAIKALRSWGRVQVLGISVGAGPALLAAADPRVAGEVSAVLSLGGYASTVELLRYFLTGTYRYGAVAGQARPDPRAVSEFIQANADLLDDAALRLVDNRDPARVEPLVRDLSPQLRDLLETLSPERVIGRLRGRLLLIHGKNDPAVPFTESLRLAEVARGRVPTSLVLLEVVGHVEPEAAPLGRWDAVGELLALWALAYEFFSL